MFPEVGPPRPDPQPFRHGPPDIRVRITQLFPDNGQRFFKPRTPAIGVKSLRQNFLDAPILVSTDHVFQIGQAFRGLVGNEAENKNAQ